MFDSLTINGSSELVLDWRNGNPGTGTAIIVIKAIDTGGKAVIDTLTFIVT